jgi:hypothetical protein
VTVTTGAGGAAETASDAVDVPQANVAVTVIVVPVKPGVEGNVTFIEVAFSGLVIVAPGAVQV